MLNVMIVDDSSIILRTLTKTLQDMGFFVCSTAKSGTEAIAHYQEFQPDLITMDITMPEMDGIEALQKIRELNTDVKVIMVTSHGEERLVMDAISFGAKGYILKPITPLKVKQAIQKAFPRLSQDIESNYLKMSMSF